MLLGGLHHPTRHGEGCLSPDLTGRNMSKVSRDSEYGAQVACQGNSQSSKGAGCDTDDVLSIHCASTDAGLPQSQPVVDCKVMGAVQKLSQPLVPGCAGFEAVLHVALQAVTVSHDGTQVFMLFLNGDATLTTMHNELQMQLASLHEGMLLPQSLRILAHKLEQYGGFVVIDGHVKGLKCFEDEGNVSYSSCEILGGAKFPGSPNVVREECQDLPNPCFVPVFSEHGEEGKRKVVPKIRRNDTALLDSVRGSGVTRVLPHLIHILRTKVQLLDDGNDVGWYTMLCHGTVEVSSCDSVESFREIKR